MKIIIITISILLTGCQTSYQTSYQPLSWSGGYSDISLGGDLKQVLFKGNGYTSIEVCVEYAMRRAGEICYPNSFKVVDINQNYSSYTTPRTTTCASQGCSSYGGVTINRPSVNLIYMCRGEKNE